MTVETPNKVEAPEKFDIPTTIHPDMQKVFKKAHAIIEAGGWCQGTLRRFAADGVTVQHCILGAVAKAVDYDPYDSVYSSISSPIPLLYVNVSSLLGQVLKSNPAVWNDAPSRTKEDVLHLLEELYQ